MPTFAVKPNGPSAYRGLSHPGESSQLYLYEKDSDWQPVVDGAWGKMTFDDNSFVFNGHGLEPYENYALIVYDTYADDDPSTEWPGEGPILALGPADEYGDIHLSDGLTSLHEAKIWLVLYNDVYSNGVMHYWHPAEYLFEYDRISN